MDYDAYRLSFLPTYYIESKYDDYARFKGLFDIESNNHRDSGDSQVFYLQDYEYPVIIDSTEEYVEYLKKHLTNLPYKNIRHKKSWWVDYPKHSYAGLHAHQPGNQITCILFLDDYKEDLDHPHAGYLYAVLGNSGEVTYQEWKPEAGTLVILDGRVWHGTYPTRHKRSVFVVDLEYDLGDF
jgi:hypothetical protein